MLSLDKQKKYIIWGTGIIAMRFFCSHCEHISIEYFVDNNVDSEYKNILFNKEVKNPANIDFSGKYVIVACQNVSTYFEIKKQLCHVGMKEFTDFAYYVFYEKEIAIIHGNCHTRVIRKMLESSSDFLEHYFIYPIPQVQYLINAKISEDLLDNVDIFIHEDIQVDNSIGYYVSDEYMYSKLRPDVKNIIIPHLFGLGSFMFPQSEYNPSLCRWAGSKNITCFVSRDRIIDSAILNGYDLKSIKGLIKEQVFSEEEIKNNFEYYISKIKERENAWSFRISDYILENYKKEKLFYDQNHPTNSLLKEISIRILQELGIQEKDLYADEVLDINEEFVYECVKKTLDIRWDETIVRKSLNARRMAAQMDYEQYVREYLYWCHEIVSD